MGLEALCAVALHKGAGVSLREVKSSTSYRRKLTHYRSLLKKYPAGTDVGDALRHRIYFAGDIYAVFEKNALELIRDIEYPDPNRARTVPAYAETFALIHEVGDRIIWKAASMAPKEMRRNAKRWKKIGVRKQLNLFDMSIEEDMFAAMGMTPISEAFNRRERLKKQAYDECYPLPLYDEEEDDDVLGYGWFEAIQQQYSMASFLPHSMGERTPGGRPSCLGLAVLMCGVAYLTGARYHFCTTLQPVGDILYPCYAGIYQSLAVAVEEFDYFNLGGGLLSELQLAQQEYARLSQSFQDWHHSIVIDTDVGLFHMDPYMRRSRPFQNTDDGKEYTTVQFSSDALCKYTPALPGLATTMLELRDNKAWADNLEDSVKQAIQDLEQLRSDMKSLRAYDIQTITDSCPTIKRLCWIQQSARSLKRCKTRRHTLWRGLFGEIADDKNGRRAALKAEKQRYNRFLYDAEYRQERCNLLYVRYLKWLQHVAIGDLNRAYRQGTSHQWNEPAIEMMHPAFGLALTVLSNIRSWTKDETSGIDWLWIGNSQMFWHEAVSPLPDPQDLTNEDKVMLRYWNRHLSTMPRVPLHKRVAMKLELTKQLPGMEVPDDRGSQQPAGDDSGGGSSAAAEVPG